MEKGEAKWLGQLTDLHLLSSCGKLAGPSPKPWPERSIPRGQLQSRPAEAPEPSRRSAASETGRRNASSTSQEMPAPEADQLEVAGDSPTATA